MPGYLRLGHDGQYHDFTWFVHQLGYQAVVDKWNTTAVDLLTGDVDVGAVQPDDYQWNAQIAEMQQPRSPVQDTPHSVGGA